MKYFRMQFAAAKEFCDRVFKSYGFSDAEAGAIADALLAADLSGIESHGVQRLVRYDFEINSGMVDVSARPETVFETPISCVIDANRAMGQLAARRAMEVAIAKARETGAGFVTVRNSNHFGIAGYYAEMASKRDMIGMAFTNSEAIMVPTFAKRPMLGTNPIAFAMPAEPYGFLFDGATTVVPRGKLEVYKKRGGDVPDGWLLDENGLECSDPARVLDNIIGKRGGGILPLGGAGETTSGYKGYGFGMLCEIATSILSLGATSDQIYANKGRAEICHGFAAIDYGIFGNKSEIKARLSRYLQKLRETEKADGQARVYTHGEKEAEARADRLRGGILINEKTLGEMRDIAGRQGVDFDETVISN